jgi:hypothetical protein
MLNNDLETLLFVRSATEEISLLQCLLIVFLCKCALNFSVLWVSGCTHPPILPGNSLANAGQGAKLFLMGGVLPM